MTRGIENPDDYYYRRLFVDAVRAVDVLAGHPLVDASRVGVVGGSQGGAIALAVGALRDDVAAVASFVPFLCDFRRASMITNNEPYKELGRFLSIQRDGVDAAFRTLSYFDGVNMAKRITAPTWVSAALMDETCPPSTVFGAFHNLAGEKDIAVWPYNAHEGGGPLDEERAVRAFAALLRD
jgi:cephalosporin-C deacetylase